MFPDLLDPRPPGSRNQRFHPSGPRNSHLGVQRGEHAPVSGRGQIDRRALGFVIFGSAFGMSSNELGRLLDFGQTRRRRWPLPANHSFDY